MRHRLLKFILPTLAVMALAGCTAAPISQGTYNAGFFRPLPGGVFQRDPTLEFIQDYQARVDEGYRLPAIPVEKIDKRYLRQRVAYSTREKPGTIIVDVANRFLYLIEPNGTAIRYGVGVGRAGFEWEGNAYIGFKRKWPTWTPPEEMIKRQPELAKYSADNGGKEPGLDNPLGARALYLFQNGQDTLYRLHGTPEWHTIGTAASSGCIRLINQDVIDLYERVKGRPRVVVRQ